MKCPHCGYQDAIAGNPGEPFVQGQHGDFYFVGIGIREHKKYPSMTETKKMFACPECYRIFISDEVY